MLKLPILPRWAALQGQSPSTRRTADDHPEKGRRLVGTASLVARATVVVAAGAVIVAACGPSRPKAARAPRPANAQRADARLEPALHAFVGQLSGSSATKIAVLTGKDSALAYVCDSKQVADLLEGRAGPGSAALDAPDGATLNLTYDNRVAHGTLTLPGRAPLSFTATAATGRAGLYQASAFTQAGVVNGRWIVAADRESAGAVRLNGAIVANPPLATTVHLAIAELHPTAQTTLTNTSTASPVVKFPPVISDLIARDPDQIASIQHGTAFGDSGGYNVGIAGKNLTGNIEVLLSGARKIRVPATVATTLDGLNPIEASFTMPRLAPGVWSVLAQTVDGTSNAISITVVPDPPPVITGLIARDPDQIASIQHGTAFGDSGGYNVGISGEHLIGNIEVLLSGARKIKVPATVATTLDGLNPIEASFTIPQLTPGVWSVQAQTVDGTSNAVSITVVHDR